MTTKLIIKNAACSNGDVNVRTKCGTAVTAQMLYPGEQVEHWISTGHDVMVDETWPTKKAASETAKAGEIADALIDAEVAVSEKKWGDANERSDTMDGQLLDAAIAQADAIYNVSHYSAITSLTRERHFEDARVRHFPAGWSGFRDYGSDIANLVVAAAYLRNEIKRRILKGESTYRAPRENDKAA